MTLDELVMALRNMQNTGFRPAPCLVRCVDVSGETLYVADITCDERGPRLILSGEEQ